MIYQIAVLALAALLQLLPGFGFLGLKPNLVLIVLLIFSFMTKSGLDYLALLLAALVLLNWGAKPAGALALVVVAAFFLGKILPWQTLLNFLFLLALASAGFYLLTDARFIFKESPLFFQELAYNLITGGLLFLILARFYESQTRIKL